MSTLNQILSALGVKGAIVQGQTGRGNYLIKTNDLGFLDPDMLPFDVHTTLTYYVDSANGQAPADGGTGGVTNPFKTIAQAVAANTAETSGGSPFTIVLARGTYAGANITNIKQTSVTFVSLTPQDAIINSPIQVMYSLPLVTAQINLYGVKVTDAVTRTDAGGFIVYLMNRAQASSVTTVTASGSVYVSPGSLVSSTINMNIVWVSKAQETSYSMATPADWLLSPILVSTALDELAALVGSGGDNLMKLDGTSQFKDAATKLFRIRRTGFYTDVGFEAIGANATVTIPNRSGMLPVVADSVGAGVLNATWSTDKLTTQFGLYVAKIGGTMTGPLVLDDTSLQMLEGAHGITLMASGLSASRAVTFGDYAGQITVAGNTFNGASQLVQMTAGAVLPAVNGSLLTSMTKAQVGLTSVTDDAQLKRAAADFESFTVEAAPVAADIVLIEQAAGSTWAKRKATIGSVNIDTASNIGSLAGYDVLAGKSGNNFQFYRLLPGLNVTMTAGTNGLEIATAGSTGVAVTGAVADQTELDALTAPPVDIGQIYVTLDDGHGWLCTGTSGVPPQTWEDLGAVRGPAGGNGTNGTSGSSGVNGTSGINGTDGTSGSSGTEGTSGSSGTSGTSGIDGTSGAAGTSGTAGTSGSSGSSGISVVIKGSVQALADLPGGAAYGDLYLVLDDGHGYIWDGSWTDVGYMQGPAGTSGTSGSSGTRGTSGTSGSSGQTGTSGTSGAAGTSGTRGTSGTSGTRGTSGSSGSSGIDGSYLGTDGTSGSSGSSGSSGTSGATGTHGTSGTSAASGTSGTFITADGKTVTVTDGIVTAITGP